MQPITLPSGATALLRTGDQITERVRKPYLQCQRRLATSELAGVFEKIKAEGRDKPTDEESRSIAAHPDYDLLDETERALIAALVASWSYDFPVTVDNVLDVPLADKAALSEHVKPHVDLVTPDFSVTPDPDSPTPPSAD